MYISYIAPAVVPSLSLHQRTAERSLVRMGREAVIKEKTDNGRDV